MGLQVGETGDRKSQCKVVRGDWILRIRASRLLDGLMIPLFQKDVKKKQTNYKILDDHCDSTKMC